MTTWTLVILMGFFGHAAAVTVPGYPTAQACLASARFAKQQPYAATAYCVMVPGVTR